MTDPGSSIVRSRDWKLLQVEEVGTSPFQAMFGQTRQRLVALALFVAGLLLLVQAIYHTMFYGLGWEPPPVWDKLRVTQAVFVVVSFVVAGLARSERVPEHAQPSLGMAYLLLGAFLISFPGFTGEVMLQQDMARLPWVGMWIALFPLVVPLPPIRAALVSFASATLAPAIFFVWSVASATPPPDAPVLVATFLPIYIAAGLALIPAVLMQRLGSSISAARDQLEQLGSYKLVERLGQGGMGEVWRAEHELLARPAAVKLISKELLIEGEESEQRTTLARFEREARTTSALRSPHTIALYDFGITPDGSPFYVMELLDGLDLDSLVMQFGPLSASRTIHILTQACCSLAEAHVTGMVHRDIKPANVYLCRLGISVDFVKVLDFGLVGVTEHLRRADDVRLTEEGFIVGTPAYMPPEMAEGKPMDGRADIYSLGCVAFWLLTGQFVFERESAVKMIISHVKDSPERPSTRLKKPIPPDLEDVILSCLEKNPEERPQDAEELARRLRACDVPPWTQDEARAWWKQHLTPEAKAAQVAAAATAPTESWPQVQTD